MNLKILLLGVSLCISSFASAQTIYQNIYNSVDKTKLVQVLKEMTGVVPVTVQGEQFSITNRYSSEAKANYRKYWTQYFQGLGMQVQEFAYKTAHTKLEAQGHNLEAILPGMSADSVVIIVHYDSIGPSGSETGNPGVDDDMSGMSVSLETARILAPYAGKLKYTVRFVAADFEEWSGPGLEGARVYAKYIKDLSTKQGFKIVAAVDNEQIGWSGGDHGKTVDIFSCSGGKYDFKAIGDALANVTAKYSKLQVKRSCIGQNSDHYAMWEIGVPAVVYSEHNPFSNPHFDQNGNDTFNQIDQDYFYSIAQVGVTFATQLAGVPDAMDAFAPQNLLTFFQQ
jgi:hypothetical protein